MRRQSARCPGSSRKGRWSPSQTPLPPSTMPASSRILRRNAWSEPASAWPPRRPDGQIEHLSKETLRSAPRCASWHKPCNNLFRGLWGIRRPHAAQPPRGPNRMNQNFRNFALWAVILLLLVALFNLFQSPTGQTGAQEITYSQFRNDTNDGKVTSVVISGQEVTGKYDDGSRFRTTAPENADYV